MWLFQMVALSLKVREAQLGTTLIHPRAAPVSPLFLFQSTQAFPPALFHSTNRMELCGPATCFPRPASHLQLPFLIAGPTAWTTRAQAVTQMFMTSTIPTPTSTLGTITPCFIHTQLTARHWIPDSIHSCCLVLGAKVRHPPTQGVPHTARGWRQGSNPAATTMSRLPLPLGLLLVSMDL